MFISLIVSGRYLRILQSDWFRERSEFSYLLTTGMVTNYAKRRVKLRIERANFQNMTKKQTKSKHWQKTNDDKNTTFPVFLNSFSYFPKIEFRNKYKFYSPALVGPYWEKLCPRSRVRPKRERKREYSMENAGVLYLRRSCWRIRKSNEWVLGKNQRVCEYCTKHFPCGFVFMIYVLRIKFLLIVFSDKPKQNSVTLLQVINSFKDFKTSFNFC